MHRLGIAGIDLDPGDGARSLQVREDDCVGCRLCYNVCPVDHCIEMVELPSGRDPITWDQLREDPACGHRRLGRDGSVSQESAGIENSLAK